jgi:hypothetical protein
MLQRLTRTALAAALFIVATLLVFVPELRTPQMRIALNSLAIPLMVLGLWQSYKSGVLRLTPGQIYESFRKGDPLDLPPKQGSLLETLALVMALPAMFLVQWTLGSN